MRDEVGRVVAAGGRDGGREGKIQGERWREAEKECEMKRKEGGAKEA